LFPHVLRLPDDTFYRRIKGAISPFVEFLGRSLVFQEAIRKVADLRIDPKLRYQQARHALESMLAVAEKHRTPVILVRQMTPRLGDEFYEGLLNDCVSLVKVEDVFRSAPPSDADLNAYDASKTWLRDIAPA